MEFAETWFDDCVMRGFRAFFVISSVLYSFFL